MTVGERIAQYRNAAGLSQRALAIKSEITSQAINQYESGKRTPDLKCFIAICRTLGVSIDIFIKDIAM